MCSRRLDEERRDHQRMRKNWGRYQSWTVEKSQGKFFLPKLEAGCDALIIREPKLFCFSRIIWQGNRLNFVKCSALGQKEKWKRQSPLVKARVECVLSADALWSSALRAAGSASPAASCIYALTLKMWNCVLPSGKNLLDSCECSEGVFGAGLADSLSLPG